MACGVPCVVTDVGDSRVIVGNTGIVVPPKNPEKLAEGWKTMLKQLDENSAISEKCRSRIISLFSLERCVQKTLDILIELV